jgi:hypothetical protein
MDSKLVQAISKDIYRRFPEFAGVKPKVRQQQAPQAKSLSAATTYLLTFQSTGRAATSSGSKNIPRWVRVVVNSQGKILKVTTSR